MIPPEVVTDQPPFPWLTVIVIIVSAFMGHRWGYKSGRLDQLNEDLEP